MFIFIFSATRLLSGETLSNLRFLQLLYCISLPEDAPIDTIIGKVEVSQEKGTFTMFLIRAIINLQKKSCIIYILHKYTILLIYKYKQKTQIIK